MVIPDFVPNRAFTTNGFAINNFLVEGNTYEYVYLLIPSTDFRISLRLCLDQIMKMLAAATGNCCMHTSPKCYWKLRNFSIFLLFVVYCFVFIFQSENSISTLLKLLLLLLFVAEIFVGALRLELIFNEFYFWYLPRFLILFAFFLNTL